MSELARVKRSVFWGQLRRALRPVGKPRAFVGWMLLLLDTAHRVDFVTSLFHGTGTLAFFQQWGWLVGIAWLIAVVVWAANKPQDEEVQRAHAMEALRRATVNAISRFEVLSRAYERLSPGSSGEVQDGRRDFLVAIEDVLKAALRMVSEEQRQEYLAMLEGAYNDHLDSYHDQPTLYSAVCPPTLPIERVIGMPASPGQSLS